MYELLVWAGAALSVVGLAGLIWSVVRVASAKRQKLADEELRAVIQGGFYIMLLFECVSLLTAG